MLIAPPVQMPAPLSPSGAAVKEVYEVLRILGFNRYQCQGRISFITHLRVTRAAIFSSPKNNLFIY